MSGSSTEIPAQIVQMHASIQEANYYELLGVEEDADAARINSAHRGLIKRFHIDALRRHGLTAEQEAMVQEINAAINAAKTTLGNSEKRADYDLELHGEQGSSVVDIFNADALFLRGRATLDRGGVQGAHEMFEEALGLNPDDKDIFLYLKYTEFQMLAKSEDGVTLERKRDGIEIFNIFEDEMEKRDEVPDWLVAQTGALALGIGKRNTAKSRFKQALRINPENKQAARQLRLLEMREDKENNKGFLEKFLEKLGIGK